MGSNTVKGMRQIRPLAAVITALALLGGTASADLQSGKAKLLRGDYAAAITDLGKVGGHDKGEAQRLLARLYLRVGKYDKAEKTADKQARGGDLDAKVVLAEIYRLRGRYADAVKELEAVTRAKPDNLRAQWQLALGLRELGRKKDAHAVLEAAFIDPVDAQTYDTTDADKLFYLGVGARWFGEYELANDAFRESVALAPNRLEANIEWGYLFLEKYAASLAEQSFEEVLKIDPRHPDANAGMATVKLEESYDLKAAQYHLEQALSVNPKHVPSLLLRATIEIDKNQWDAAKATINEVLAVNPENFEAQSLLATIYWLRDDGAAYKAEKQTILTENPEYAELYHIIARSAVREHRYVEAIDLEKAAVKLDPDYYEAMQGVGTGYLRLGMEKEGLAWLNKAWKGDEYNVRTYNTLQLFDEIIPKQYTTATTKYFKFRYHKEEKAMLERYIAPLLTRAFEDMVKRYHFTPTTPVSIELFQQADHYSVRTVGLPNLGALGVCFGKVITAMSPSVGDVNWGMVLWHELAHVFAIQLSKSRVPRWYTEGLSEYETLIARPEWRRENDVDVWQAMADGTLPSVAELNYNFMKPNMQDVVVAYHLSSVTIEFIAQTYGFDKIVDGLQLFGKGLETPAVIEKITGLTVPQFDAKFREYLAIRLKAYKGTFRLPSRGLDDVKQLEIDAAAKPKSAEVQSRLALGRFFDGDAPGAAEAAAKALALDKRDRVGLYVSAELALRQRKLDDAKKLYLELIAAGGDGFDVRGRLALIARHQGDNAAAEKQLCAAKKLDPERSYPYMELSEIYEETGRQAESLHELEGYVMLEQMQYAPVRKLVTGYKRLKNWAKVRTYSEMGVQINPFDGEMHLDRGLALLETGSPDDALYEFQSALLARPELRRPALAHLGMVRAYLAKGNKRKARTELKKALELEPANAEALALKAKVK